MRRLSKTFTQQDLDLIFNGGQQTCLLPGLGQHIDLIWAWEDRNGGQGRAAGKTTSAHCRGVGSDDFPEGQGTR
jgi:hypothetical protein